MNRALKKRDKQDRFEQLRARRQARCEKVLSVFGLARSFRQLPATYRDWIVKVAIITPSIVVEGADANDTTFLKSSVERVLKEAMLEVEGTVFSLYEVWGVLLPLLDLFRGAEASPGHRHIAFFEKAAAVWKQHYQAMEERAIGQLANELARITSDYARIDRHLIACRLSWVAASATKIDLRIIILVRSPERTIITVDGKPRTAFRCGFADRHGVSWFAWSADLVGEAGSGERYPVYVQPHALQRLHERVPLTTSDVHHSMLFSLGQPRIVEQQGDDLLVEFRLYNEVRLGYFRAQLVGRQILVRTFIFLTMDRTPEARQLQERLRLCRPDIEYFGLDRLETFLRSDINQDADLVEAFRECGCEHLLALTRTIGDRQSRAGFAVMLKEYMQFDSREQPSEMADIATVIPHPKPDRWRIAQA